MDHLVARNDTRNDTLAHVRADGTTTRYRRIGTGAPVLLLCEPDDERYAPVVARLAGRRSVIAPERAEGDVEGWLRVERLTGFLDGLGLARVTVVGLGLAAGPAAALARLHPDRVEALVLLGEPNGDPAADAEAALKAVERRHD